MISEVCSNRSLLSPSRSKTKLLEVYARSAVEQWVQTNGKLLQYSDLHISGGTEML